MNKTLTKSGNRTKLIAFVLIAVLCTGLFSFPSLAGQNDAFKVTYKISANESDDIDKYVEPNDGENKANLKKEDIPDDPKDKDNAMFAGWKFLGNQSNQEDKDKTWIKEELVGAEITSDVEFEAVYEETESNEDVTKKEETNESEDGDTQSDTKLDSITEKDSSKKSKKDGVQIQADDQSHVKITIDGKEITNGGFGVVDNWDFNQAKVMTVEVSDLNNTSPGVPNYKDNYVTINVPEGLIYNNIKSDAKLIELVTDPAIIKVGAYEVKYGELGYKVKSGTKKAIIEISVAPDKIRYYSPHTVKNNITAELHSIVDNNPQTQKAEVTAKLSGTTVYTADTNPISSIYALPQQPVTMHLPYLKTEKAGESMVTFYKDVVITMKYPSEATLKDLSFSGLTKPNANLDKKWSIDNKTYEGVEVDEVNHIITLYYQNILLGSNYSVRPVVVFDDSVTPGKTYKISNYQIKGTVYDGTKFDGTNNNYVVNANTLNRGVTIAQDTDVLLLINRDVAPGVSTQDEVLNVVGRVTFANSSAKNLDNQIIRYEFPKEYNVQGFGIPCGQNETKNITITYCAFGGTEKNINLDVKGSNNKTAKITSELLGLGNGEILEYAEINCGSFRSDFNTGNNANNGACIYGYVLEKDADGTYSFGVGISNGSSVQAKDMKYVSNTPTNATAGYRFKAFIGDITNMQDSKSAKMTAGGIVNVRANALTSLEELFESSRNVLAVKNPVFYIKEPDGMTVKKGSVVAKQEGEAITVAVSETPIIRDGENYREVRTVNCITGGYEKNDLKWRESIDIGFIYELDKTMKSNTYNLKDLIFLAPEPKNLTEKSDVRFCEGASGTQIYTVKDSHDLNNNLNIDENLIIPDSYGKITVLENLVVFIGSKIKLSTEDDDKYRTYKAGDESSKVFFTPGTTAKYLVNIENRSKSEANELTVHIPVPKAGQKFGENFQASEETAWDMSLVKKVDLTNTGKAESDQTKNFDIYYMTNADGKNHRVKSNWKTEDEINGNWADVNMVIINSNTKIAGDTATNALMEYKIDVLDADAANLTGTENIFNPTYYVDYPLGTGEFPGESVATVLQVAEISGKVFLDGMGSGQLKNGIKDTNESYYVDDSKPVKVKIISGPAFKGREVTVSSKGAFIFDGLTKGIYDIQFIKPDGTNYIFTKSHAIGGTLEASNADITNGKVMNINVSAPNTAKNINAGLTVNEAPKIAIDDVITTTAGPLKLGTPVLSDDLTAVGEIDFSSKSSINLSKPGTYAVTYTAIDGHNAMTEKVQKVKVHGLPYILSADDMYKVVGDTSVNMAALSNNVTLKYVKASDTIGGATKIVDLAAEITNLAKVPSTLGKHTITFANESAEGNAITAGKLSGTYDLYLLSLPQTKGTTTGDNGNYTSGSKTNQNVKITAQAISGLTLEYKVSGGAWKAYPINGIDVTTNDYINETYSFRYAEIENLNGYNILPELMDTALSSKFTANINKTAPTLVENKNTFTVTNGAKYDDPFNAKSVPRVSGDVVTVVATKGGLGISFSNGMKLSNGEYEVKLTDGYGNVTNLTFTFNALIATAQNNSVVYDSEKHSISASGNKSSSVVYSTTSTGSFSAEKPEYDDVGTYNIWVKAVKADYPTSVAVKAELDITQRAITVKPQSAQKIYDETGLKPTTSSIVLGRIATNDAINTQTFEGVITDPGIQTSTLNAFTLKRNVGKAKDVTGNYKITKENGTLQIASAGALLLSVDDVVKTYNDTSYGLEDIAVTSSRGSIKDATLSYSTNSGVTWTSNSPKFTDANIVGYDVQVKAKRTGYDDSQAVPVKIYINQRNVTVKPNDVSKKYDGSPIKATTASATNLVSGHNLVINAADYGGSQTDAGGSLSTITTSKIDIIKGSESKKSNYNINTADGNLTVSKRNITITPDPASKTYDGKALKASSFTSDGDNLVAGQTMSVIFGGSITNAGSAKSSISSYTISGDNNKNYNVTANEGNLTVKKRSVSVRPVSASKTYDGSALTVSKVEVTSGKMVSGETIKATLSGNSRTNVGSNKITISDISVSGGKASNYNFSKGTGTITINSAGGGDNTGGGTTDGGNTGGNDNGDGTETTTNQTGTTSNNNTITPPDDTVLPGGSNRTVESTEKLPETNFGGSPVMSIGDRDIPLFGNSSFPSWSLLNLILSIAGVLMMMFLAIPIMARKRDDARLENEEFAYERRKTFNKSWVLAGSIFAVAQVLIFIFTQSLNGTMVIMDVWATVHVLATALIVASIMFALRVKEPKTV